MTSCQAQGIEEPPKVIRSPRSVDIDLTSRCNLKCLYCYYFDNPSVTYKDLPTGEWLTFFDELGRLGVMEVCLAGGEPFMRPDLKELLEGIVRNRMRFNLLSNGSLIDDDMAEFIASTGRCNYIQISIDGSSPETHDACRGKGSFEKAVRGIRILQRHGVSVASRLTIHHFNVGMLDEITDFILNDLGLPGFGTNSAGYLGSCRKNADSVQLTVEDWQLAMSALLRLEREHPGRISAAAGPLAEARQWQRMEQARIRRDPTFSIGGHLTACGCPTQKIAVRSDGIIVPCNMLPHIALGRINVDSLQEIWLKSPEMMHMRLRHRIQLEFEFCRGCPYMPYCTGNCPGLAFSITGKVDYPSPDSCLRKFLADGGKNAMNENKQRMNNKGLPRLGQIYFYLTEGCNLACRHCWIAPKFDAQAELPALPVDLFEKAISEAKPMGLEGVKLTGGEPLMHPRFTELLEIVNRDGLSLGIETNGVLCTPEVAAEIAKNPKRHISVSIDGADAVTHEWIRCVEGSFEAAKKGVKNLVASGTRPQIIFTVMRKNVGQVEKVWR